MSKTPEEAARGRLKRFMTQKFPELIRESFVAANGKPITVDSGTQAALAARVLHYYNVPYQVVTCQAIVVNRQWVEFARALGKPLNEWTKQDVLACAKKKGMSLKLGTPEDPHHVIQIGNGLTMEILDVAASLAERPAFRMKTPAYWEPATALPRYVWAVEEIENPDGTIKASRLRQFNESQRRTIVAAFIQEATVQVGYPHRVEEPELGSD